jgi:hypothetical protein
MTMGATAPEEDRKYEKVITVPDAKKDELYIKANAWMVKEFNSAESVIEFQDKESGKIMGKFTHSMSDAYSYTTKQTLSIDVQDGRARIRIEDPYIKVTRGLTGEVQNNAYAPLKTVDGLAKLKVVWVELSNSFEKAIKSTDNW